MTTNSVHKVILFGESGSGKSSVVNMIVGRKVAKVSNDPLGCTFKYQQYPATVNNIPFQIYDTAGLNEGEQGRVPHWTAIRELYTLIRELESVSLLIYCVRGRIKENTHANWILFNDIICGGHVPIILVITGLENEEDWMAPARLKRIASAFDAYNMKPKAVASIVSIRGNQQEFEDLYEKSQKELQTLIMSHHRTWSTEKEAWFKDIYVTAYSTGFGSACFGATTKLEFAERTKTVIQEFVVETNMKEDESKKLQDALLRAERKLMKEPILKRMLREIRGTKGGELKTVQDTPGVPVKKGDGAMAKDPAAAAGQKDTDKRSDILTQRKGNADSLNLERQDRWNEASPAEERQDTEGGKWTSSVLQNSEEIRAEWVDVNQRFVAETHSMEDESKSHDPPLKTKQKPLRGPAQNTVFPDNRDTRENESSLVQDTPRRIQAEKVAAGQKYTDKGSEAGDGDFQKVERQDRQNEASDTTERDDMEAESLTSAVLQNPGEESDVKVGFMGKMRKKIQGFGVDTPTKEEESKTLHDDRPKAERRAMKKRKSIFSTGGTKDVPDSPGRGVGSTVTKEPAGQKDTVKGSEARVQGHPGNQNQRKKTHDSPATAEQTTEQGIQSLVDLRKHGERSRKLADAPAIASQEIIMMGYGSGTSVSLNPGHEGAIAETTDMDRQRKIKLRQREGREGKAFGSARSDV